MLRVLPKIPQWRVRLWSIHHAKALMSHGALQNQANWIPSCMKKTKDFKHGKCREQVAKTQAQAQTQAQTSFEMAKATQLKARILQCTARQQLFGINIVDFVGPHGEGIYTTPCNVIRSLLN